MIRRCFSNKSHETIQPLYTTFVRPIIENNSSAWGPWLQKDIIILNKVQRRAENLCSDNIKFESLESRRIRCDLRETFKIYNDNYRLDSRNFFKKSTDMSTRGHEHKLAKSYSRTDIRKHFFTNRVIDNWNSLSNDIVNANNISQFKERLEQGTNW